MMNSKLLKLCAMCAVIVSITACNGKSQKSEVPAVSLDDSLTLDADTIKAINEPVKIEIDTLAFTQLEFRIGSHEWPFTYTDTTVNGRHIICGTAVTHEPEDMIYVVYNDSTTGLYPGEMSYVMVDPSSGRDLMLIRRDLVIDALNIKDDVGMNSNLKALSLGKTTFKELRNDTVVLGAFFGEYGTDNVYVLELKILKEDADTTIQVEWLPDYFTYDDE